MLRPKLHFAASLFVNQGVPDWIQNYVETIKNCPVIAVPADGKEHAISYKIASGIVKDMDQKECLGLSSPMTKDRKILEKNYQKVSEEIIKKLDEGKNVAYLTLGVPSFCAVAAKLGDSLADRSEQLHIIPSNYDIKEALKLPGNKILMKAASKLSDVKKVLKEQGQEAWMIENCGMEEEKIYHSVEEMPEKATYYTTLLVKEAIDKNS